MRREYEMLADATVVRRFDKSRFPPSGAAGGADGGAARSVINPGRTDERVLNASARFDVKAGDRLLIQTAGGGGYGEPAERDPSARAADIEEGRVSAPAPTGTFGDLAS
jgi:N-methylhydantoinase B